MKSVIFVIAMMVSGVVFADKPKQEFETEKTTPTWVTVCDGSVDEEILLQMASVAPPEIQAKIYSVLNIAAE